MGNERLISQHLRSAVRFRVFVPKFSGSIFDQSLIILEASLCHFYWICSNKSLPKMLFRNGSCHTSTNRRHKFGTFWEDGNGYSRVCLPNGNFPMIYGHIFYVERIT